ncbi:MAG: radical SAM protein [Cyclobacteriaceae bacterium]
MREVLVKSVLNKKKKRDSWFLDEYTLNPYEGCSFNCVYCYVRGSKYGTNMEEVLAVKSNALEVLERQLAFRVKKNQFGIIALASATDPYIPQEEDHKMTRGFLELILKFRFPVLIVTKSTMVLRDADLLAQIDKEAILPEDLKGRVPGAIISFSISTLDETLAKRLEPGAPLPKQRLHTMQQLRQMGLTSGLNCIPMLPFISDSETEMERMIVAAKEHYASYILMGGLTLFGDNPGDCKPRYYKFLNESYPHLVPEYRKLYRIFPMPKKDYTLQLDQTVKRLSAKHGIPNQIAYA